MRATLLAAAVLAAALAPGKAQTSCGVFDFAGPYGKAFLAGEPYADAGKAVEAITAMADGACHQDLLLKELAVGYGPVIGYKAAATSEGAQKQLGLDGPVLGVLLDGMLSADGATVSIGDGARMIFELDLLARVGDAEINAATTREEALEGLDALVPFVELGDLMVPKGAAITGPLLQAMNAGARAGVTGEPITLDGIGIDTIGAGAGKLLKDGVVVAEAPAAALLGHPLDAVLWIVEAVRGRGMELKPGDLLSLGSMGRFQLAAPGEVEALYEGFGASPASARLTLTE